MKRHALSAMLLITGTCILSSVYATAAKPAQTPNVIYILADDLGMRDLYEGGIRTPFLVRWPGKIAAGSTSAHLSAFWDIVPTMAELTGQQIPAQSDGISIVPTLLGQGEQTQHKYIYHEFIRGNAKPYSSRSLRQGDWKAVQIAKSQEQGGGFHSIELYNLKNDLGETKDLANQYPEIVDNMERFMDEAHTPLK